MSQTLTRECLSTHDQQVLDSIFNPLELTSSAPTIISADAELIDIEPDTAEMRQSKEIEMAGIKLAEEGKLELALQTFEKALAATSTERASIYNNRAQALRLMGKDDAAFEDLNKTILMCTATQLKTKCHALCQRGVLYRKCENVDAARKDFEDAAQLGSQFAKQQLVEINPFAALCNQMLRQAFDQLK